MRRLLWIVEKAFDVAPDTTTWLEVVRALQDKLDIYLVTGFRHHKKEFSQLKNRIVYLDSIKIPYFNRFSTYLSQLRNMEALIKKYAPQLVLLNTSNVVLLLLLTSLRRLYGFQVFLDIRTLPVRSDAFRFFMENQLFKTNLRLASKVLDGISYITEEMERYCKATYGLKAHNSGTWASGVNTEMFKPVPTSRSTGPLKLIYHGSISTDRGLETLIDGVDSYRRRTHSEIHLTFLGCGNALGKLKEKVYSTRLSDVVCFHGQVPLEQVPSYVAKADLGIIPLPDRPVWNVSSPIKLFEYLASGKPVIVTRIPAHKNVVGGRPFAFWIDEDQPDAIAQAIEHAYRQKNQLGTLGGEARRFALENCSWKKQVDHLHRFLLGNRAC